MFERFITRPVLATVISVILVILGVVGMTQLPITAFSRYRSSKCDGDGKLPWRKRRNRGPVRSPST